MNVFYKAFKCLKPKKEDTPTNKKKKSMSERLKKFSQCSTVTKELPVPLQMTASGNNLAVIVAGKRKERSPPCESLQKRGPKRGSSERISNDNSDNSSISSESSSSFQNVRVNSQEDVRKHFSSKIDTKKLKKPVFQAKSTGSSPSPLKASVESQDSKLSASLVEYSDTSEDDQSSTTSCGKTKTTAPVHWNRGSVYTQLNFSGMPHSWLDQSFRSSNSNNLSSVPSTTYNVNTTRVSPKNCCSNWGSSDSISLRSSSSESLGPLPQALSSESVSPMFPESMSNALLPSPPEIRRSLPCSTPPSTPPVFKTPFIPRGLWTSIQRSNSFDSLERSRADACRNWRSEPRADTSWQSDQRAYTSHDWRSDQRADTSINWRSGQRADTSLNWRSDMITDNNLNWQSYQRADINFNWYPDQRSPSPVSRYPVTSSILPWYDAEKLLTVNLGIGVIDSHCHLDFLFRRTNYQESYNKYKEENASSYPACYEGCIAIFCDPSSFQQKSMWESFLDCDGVWAAFGCHPHMAHSYNDMAETYLKESFTHDRVIALGEIGLDYSLNNKCDRDVQKKVFKRQLKIGVTNQLPLVIHCRDANKDCLSIMNEIVPFNYRIHMHCFTGNWEEAQLWLNAYPNLYLGVTALVTYPSAKTLHEAVRNIPLKRLLLETDTPYFVPRAVTGVKFSHPGMVIHVAAQVAAIKKDVTLNEVLLAVRENTKIVYGI